MNGTGDGGIVAEIDGLVDVRRVRGDRRYEPSAKLLR